MSKLYICRQCNKSKPLEDYYTRTYSTKQGIKICPRALICKDCWAEFYKTREKQNERRRERYINDENYREKLKNNSLEYHHKHKKRCNKKSKRYYENNKERILLELHIKLAQERQSLIELLSGKCISCGIDDPTVLEFDHIKPLYSAKRKYSNILREVKKFPERFQLLCANCHRRKTLIDLQKFYRKKRKIQS